MAFSGRMLTNTIMEQ